MDHPIRCKFFDDDGNPIASGCRFGATKCRFVHPGDPFWNSSMPYRGRRKSDRSGPSTGSKRTSSRSQNDMGRVSYNDSEWGNNKHTRRNSNSSLSNATGDTTAWGWGDPSNGPGLSTNKTSETQRPPHTSTSDSVGSWGASWNLDSWGDSMKNSSWGDGSGIEGTPDPWSENTSGWGQSAWGESTNQSSSKADERKAASTISQSSMNSPRMLHASPALLRVQKNDRERGAGVSASEAISSSSTQASTRAAQDVDMKDSTQTTSSAPVPAPRKIPLPTRRPLLPTRVKQPSTASSSVPEPTHNQQASLSPAIPPQDWSKIPLSGSITRRVQDDVASDASGPVSHLITRDPKELHEKLVKEMTSAVLIRYRLLKAEDKKTKWRGARQSSCYHHSTPAAQKILESTNHQFSEALGKLNKQLNSSLKRVIQYSDALNTHKDFVAKGLDSQKILSYTDELRDWVASVELPRRMLATKVLIQQEKDEEEAFRRRKREEVDALKNAMSELELKASDLWDDFCHLQYIQPERFREEHSAAEEAMENGIDTMPHLEKLFVDLGVGRDGVETTMEGVKTANQNIDDHAAKAKELQEEIRVLEDEVAELKQKDQEINEFRQEAQAKLMEMQSWETEDKQGLDRMTQKIESLHEIPRPRTGSPPAVIRTDDLAPYINELVTEYVAKEIKPALDAIAEACERNNQLVKAEFDKLVEQVVTKTYDLVQMALKANGLVPQIVPKQS